MQNNVDGMKAISRDGLCGVNAHLVLWILHELAAHADKVQVSTDYVFSGKESFSRTEQDAPYPVSAHGDLNWRERDLRLRHLSRL